MGVKDLVIILKYSVCLNESEQSENVSHAKRVISKTFKLTYLSASEWENLLNMSTNPNAETKGQNCVSLFFLRVIFLCSLLSMHYHGVVTRNEKTKCEDMKMFVYIYFVYFSNLI